MTTTGFSGGFFLPAQRSVHCKGGFFAADASSTSSAAGPRAPVSLKRPPGRTSGPRDDDALNNGDPGTERRRPPRNEPNQDDDEHQSAQRPDAVGSNQRGDRPSRHRDRRAEPERTGTHSSSSASSRFVRPRHEKVGRNSTACAPYLDGLTTRAHLCVSIASSAHECEASRVPSWATGNTGPHEPPQSRLGGSQISRWGDQPRRERQV